MTHALVTGASGFIGRHLIRALAEQGHSVAALSRRPIEGFPVRTGIVWFQGDVTDADSLQRAAKGADVVFHLAAVVGGQGATPEVQERVGVEGTENVAEAAFRAGVNRMVHMSSTAVYAPQSGCSVTTEESPLVEDLDAAHPYVRQKVLAEYAAWRADTVGKLQVTCIRPPMVIGTGDRNLLSLLGGIFTATSGEVVQDSWARVPIVVVDELVRGLIAASDSPASAHRAYNLASTSPITKSELRQAFAVAGFVPRPSLKKRAPVIAASCILQFAELPFRLAGSAKPTPPTRLASRVLALRLSPPLRDQLVLSARAHADFGWLGTGDYREAAKKAVKWSNEGERWE